MRLGRNRAKPSNSLCLDKRPSVWTERVHASGQLSSRSSVPRNFSRPPNLRQILSVWMPPQAPTPPLMPSLDHSGGSSAAASNHRWQKITYSKCHRHQNELAIPDVGDQLSNGISTVKHPNVFALVEQKAQERRRPIEFAVVVAFELRSPAAATASDEDEEDSEAEGAV
ncbi:hypothetical protein IEQ34_018573 [Dendrobium chrysotoxum]|uniref:Uncharacterized protein n=1 Tax=Dendrobium chrysotoxum TaxID=161865 RepID=A0AAV7FNW5_DENCH|nr:hypothetical protein IEQ34_018573 [Dendrobium chrysotoxum]